MTPETPARLAAERWFLDNGRPWVLRPDALVRHVWPRSAPTLAAFAVMMACSVVIVAVTGKHTISIDRTPTRTEWFALAVVLLVLPIAAVVGWSVSRIRSIPRRHLASAISIAVMVIGGLFGGPTASIAFDLVAESIVIATIFICTATGLGSMMGWAVRMTMQNLASAGSLLVRALPVFLLTILVFFNGSVWLMVDIVTRPRLWLALGFLFLVAATFLTSSTLERVRPILDATQPLRDDNARLAGTPFEGLPDHVRWVPLSRLERTNIVLVLAVSQIIQVLTVAVVTSSIFFILGLILVSPELLAAWTRNGSSSGEFLGMTFPVPQSLIQITMFLGALTFMYLSARVVSDKQYRAAFVDPLIDELRLTLVARDRYRTATRRATGDR